MTRPTIRTPRRNEAPEIVELVRRSFDEFIAPGYDEDGISHFYEHITIEDLNAAIHDDRIVFAAILDEQPVGVINVRDDTHIMWLYVEGRFHRRGIARQLVARVAREISVRTPAAEYVTLNSSPFAVPIYTRMGFSATGPETTENGMRFTPMRATIATLVDPDD